jgi:uncharacterized protein (TIGR02466 family)
MLQPIFPTIIATLENENASPLETDILLNAEYEGKKEGYSITKDRYILNKVPKLKRWIQDQLDQYTVNVMGISTRLILLQSWCLKTEEKPQILYTHRHPNSIISGAYYVNASEDAQGLTFFNNRIEPMVEGPYIWWEKDLDISDKPWLFDKATFPAKTNNMILFPSHVKHGVEGYDKKEMRCVLSFNTWFADGIGDNEHLTRLDLPPKLVKGMNLANDKENHGT